MISWRDFGKRALVWFLGLGAATAAFCVALSLKWPGKVFTGPGAAIQSAYVQAWQEGRPLPLWEPAPHSGAPTFLSPPPLSPALTALLSQNQTFSNPALAATLGLGALALILVLGALSTSPVMTLAWSTMGTTGILAASLLKTPDHVMATGLVALGWALAAVMRVRLSKSAGLLTAALLYLASGAGALVALVALLFGAATRPGIAFRPLAILQSTLLPLLQGALMAAPYWLPWLQEAPFAGDLLLIPAGTTSPLVLAMGTILGCLLLERTLLDAGTKTHPSRWEWQCARIGSLIMVGLALVTIPPLKIRLEEPSPLRGRLGPISAVLKQPVATRDNALHSILGLGSGKADVTCQWRGMNQFQCQAFAITATQLENQMREYPGWSWTVNGKKMKDRKTKIAPGAHEIRWTLQQTPLRYLSFVLCLLGLIWALAETMPFTRRSRHGAIS